MARLDDRERVVYTIIERYRFLKVFTKVERISTAAFILKCSRNTVSKAVKDLVEFGLLERTEKGVQLTPLGRLILKDLDEFYALLESHNHRPPRRR